MTTEPSPNPTSATLVPTVPDPFDQELCALVLDIAPRLFAVVQVFGNNPTDADGWVVAWGFVDSEGPAHVIGIDGRARLTLASPERALRHFAGQPGLTSRLVWLAQPSTARLDRAEVS